MGKMLIVDLPVLLGKLGIKGVESLVKWEDKLGIKEGCANLGEVCKVLFNEAKQAWEGLAAYEARMQAVRELEKKQELFRFAFDAENYYLGQDKMLGYMMAEMVQIVFGGEILKGAAKGVSKGSQFVKEVQQGVKIEKRIAGGAKLMEELQVVEGYLSKEKNINLFGEEVTALNKATQGGGILLNGTPHSIVHSASYYSHATDQAAAIFKGIIKNHTFLDGNKRTAIEAIKSFASKSGIKINLSESQLIEIALEVEANKLADITEIAAKLFK